MSINNIGLSDNEPCGDCYKCFYCKYDSIGESNVIEENKGRYRCDPIRYKEINRVYIDMGH